MLWNLVPAVHKLRFRSGGSGGFGYFLDFNPESCYAASVFCRADQDFVYSERFAETIRCHDTLVSGQLVGLSADHNSGASDAVQIFGQYGIAGLHRHVSYRRDKRRLRAFRGSPGKDR